MVETFIAFVNCFRAKAPRGPKLGRISQLTNATDAGVDSVEIAEVYSAGERSWRDLA